MPDRPAPRARAAGFEPHEERLEGTEVRDRGRRWPYEPGDSGQAVRAVHAAHSELSHRACVILRKTDTGSGGKRTAFRSYPNKVPAGGAHLSELVKSGMLPRGAARGAERS